MHRIGLLVVALAAMVCCLASVASESLLPNGTFEEGFAHRTPRSSSGENPARWQFSGESHNLNGLVDACTDKGGSPRDGGDRSLLLFDNNKSDADSRLNVMHQIALTAGGPMTLQTDLRFNSHGGMAGQNLTIQITHESGDHLLAGLHIVGNNDDGITVSALGTSETHPLTTLKPGVWYRLSMQVASAPSPDTYMNVAVVNLASGATNSFVTYAHKSGPENVTPNAIYFTSGFGPIDTLDVNLDNISFTEGTSPAKTP
jgi:hypothetical protein